MSEQNGTIRALWEEIATVEDPEIFMSITDLGLVYDVAFMEGRAHVKMTLTSMGCPLGPQIQSDVREACLRVEGVDEADVEFVWSPPWDPKTMASEDAKLELGLA